MGIELKSLTTELYGVSKLCTPNMPRVRQALARQLLRPTRYDQYSQVRKCKTADITTGRSKAVQWRSTQSNASYNEPVHHRWLSCSQSAPSQVAYREGFDEAEDVEDDLVQLLGLC